MKSRSFTLFERAIKSDQTKSVYTYSLHEFMKFTKITQYDDIVKLSTDKIQKLLENGVMDLASRNLKAATIRSKIGAVELFLEMNKKTHYKKGKKICDNKMMGCITRGISTFCKIEPKLTYTIFKKLEEFVIQIKVNKIMGLSMFRF